MEIVLTNSIKENRKIQNVASNDGEYKQLSNLGVFSKGAGIQREDITSCGYPCIRYGEIYTSYNFFAYKFSSFTHEKGILSSKKIKTGDILFAGSGETLDEIGKAVVYLGKEEAYAGGDIIIFTPNSKVLPEFVTYALESNNVKRQKRKLGQGHSVVHIYSKSLSQIKIWCPTLQEQKKITAILFAYQKNIETKSTIVAQLRQRNRSLMQQLLTGKKRLKGFENSTWTKQSLSHYITPIIREVKKPKSNFFALGIRSHGKGIFHKPDFDPEDLSMEVLYVVKENDLIVNITFAWEQAIAIARKEDDGGLVSHRFPTYEFKKGIASHLFFKFLIIQKHFKYMLDLISPGGAGRNRVMSKKDFLKLEILAPSYHEQVAIADVLNCAEKELNCHLQLLEQLKQQKRGLMQKLLTGEVRVKT